MSTPLLQTSTHNFYLRVATTSDISSLNDMISLSVRTLHTPFYSSEVIDSAMRYVYGVDRLLISDETYYLIEAFPKENEGISDQLGDQRDGQRDDQSNIVEGKVLVAAGGWSFRSTLYGGSQASHRDPTPLDPATDAAKLRAMFVHPSFTRLGLAQLMLKTCEEEVKKKGFKRLEFGATFAGISFYQRAGYAQLKEEGQGGKGRCDRTMQDGRVLELVKMGRSI